MAAVYVSNLVINTGSTFQQQFELENVSSNSALDIAGFTISSQMRKHAAVSYTHLTLPTNREV